MTSQQPPEVLRAVWAASEGAAELDDDCGPTKTCRNMRDFSFDDLPESLGAAAGTDLGSAWREKLRREGKLGTGGSIRDLVLGPAEQE